MNQRGFATLEVILMIVVIGILATVAVPRFTDVTTKANTAKIQSDLTTIDTAIQIYYMEKGEWPTSADLKTELKPYLNDFPKVPTGSAYLEGKVTEISTIDSGSTGYTTKDEIISGTGDSAKKVVRAALGGHLVSEFTLPK